MSTSFETEYGCWLWECCWYIHLPAILQLPLTRFHYDFTMPDYMNITHSAPVWPLYEVAIVAPERMGSTQYGKRKRLLRTRNSREHRGDQSVRRISVLEFCVWPPMWYSGQSSWLQIQTSGLDSRRYQIFREVVVGLELGPLSLVSTTEELLGRKSSGSDLQNREYGRRDPLRWPCDLYPQKLALTSPTSGGRYSSVAD
jgi:hypothetical protein